MDRESKGPFSTLLSQSYSLITPPPWQAGAGGGLETSIPAGNRVHSEDLPPSGISAFRASGPFTLTIADLQSSVISAMPSSWGPTAPTRAGPPIKLLFSKHNLPGIRPPVSWTCLSRSRETDSHKGRICEPERKNALGIDRGNQKRYEPSFTRVHEKTERYPEQRAGC